ncbi:hypothetical protein KR044_005980, partial [Drosophila immigrans]
IQRVMDQCGIENDVTHEQFEKIFEHNATELNDVEMKYKCFIHCTSKGFDILDSNDHMDMDKLDKLQEFSEHRNDFVECKTLNDYEQDKCEYAFKFMICLKKKYDV